MAADGDGPRVCGAVTIVSATDKASSGDVDCNCWGNEEELCTSKQFKVDSIIPTEPQGLSWASNQMCKTAGCACTGNIFPATAG